MATDTTPAVGLDHPTVVPANFDREERTCPDCGRPIEDH